MREPPYPPLPRFPSRRDANAWMLSTLLHWMMVRPDKAHYLFDPSRGDYMPDSVHVGSAWRPEHQAFYRMLKRANPDLVQRAREDCGPNPLWLSRVGDPEDFPETRGWLRG